MNLNKKPEPNNQKKKNPNKEKEHLWVWLFDYLVTAFSKKGDIFDQCSFIHTEWLNWGSLSPKLKSREGWIWKNGCSLSFLLKKEQTQGWISTQKVTPQVGDRTEHGTHLSALITAASQLCRRGAHLPVADRLSRAPLCACAHFSSSVVLMLVPHAVVNPLLLSATLHCQSFTQNWVLPCCWLVMVSQL